MFSFLLPACRQLPGSTPDVEYDLKHVNLIHKDRRQRIWHRMAGWATTAYSGSKLCYQSRLQLGY